MIGPDSIAIPPPTIFITPTSCFHALNLVFDSSKKLIVFEDFFCVVMEVVQEDLGEEDKMQCIKHPYKNNTPGGICAFCLQEKLGKLVSSSFPVVVFPSSSSSSTPSFRSDYGGGGGGGIANTTSSSIQLRSNTSSSNTNDQYYSRRSRIPFLLIQRKKMNNSKDVFMADSDQTSIVFKRSKSTVTTPRRSLRFSEADYAGDRKRGFWSFLYFTNHSLTRKTERPYCKSGEIDSLSRQRSRDKEKEQSVVVVNENESPDPVASLDRKVSRSRSVGCGSRSFSGDFFDRISTGLGDCTLRRVESQREGSGKHKVNAVHGGGQDCIKERVKCGGIFSGFMISSSSSSSSSSTEDLGHGKSKSWSWALASPIKAFGKYSSSSGKQHRDSSNKNSTPNMAAIPSLLAVRP